MAIDCDYSIDCTYKVGPRCKYYEWKGSDNPACLSLEEQGSSKIAYRVGCHVPDFVDQRYIRDRDIWTIKEESHKGKLEAIQEFIDSRKGWLRADEVKFVTILETKDIKEVPEHLFTWR